MRKTKRFNLVLVGLVSLVIGGFLAGCQASTTAPTKKIQVVTTTDFYGEVAREVGGRHVEVQSIINRPAIDPHDYEPTTAVAKTVAQADIAIANGIGYDGWMNKLVKTSSKTRLIRVGEDVMGRSNGVNEHLWYDPATMPKLAAQLAAQFSRQAPRYRQTFQQNAKRYVASLKPINREIKRAKAQAAQLSNKQVLVSEPVFDYALNDLGLKVANVNFENAVEKGTDPSPRVIKQMQTMLKKRQVAFFVDNQQVSDKLVTNMVKLADQNDVPVLKVTETKPAHKTYQQWMLSQYRQLNQILADTIKTDQLSTD